MNFLSSHFDRALRVERAPLFQYALRLGLALGVIAGVPACSNDVTVGFEAASGATGTTGAGGGTGAGSATGAGGAGVGSTGAGGNPVTIDWGPCPNGFQTECAAVALPLDYNDPTGEQTPIFLSRQRAKTSPANAQLWFLQGGPGGSGDVFGYFIDQLAAALADFDFYVLEHRGVGGSARLSCAAQESPASPSGTIISTDEWPACIDSLKTQWGGRLAHFTTTGDSRDLTKLIELTREPGQKVFVYGVSYGTTRGLRFLQLDPPAIDGVILDSVVSPGVQYLSHFDEQFEPVAMAFSALCAVDPVCSAKLGPNPWTAVTSGIDNLKTNTCAALGQTGPLLLAYLPVYLRYLSLRAHIFPLLYRASRCDPEDVQVITHYVDQVATLVSGSASARSSPSLQNHVVLSEIWEEPAPALSELQSRCDSVYFCPNTSVRIGALYDMWPRYPHEVFTGQWPSTTVPVLSMNGTLDPQTPHALAQAIQTKLTGAYQTFVTIPNMPHGLIGSSPVKTPGAPHCALQMLIGFVKDPHAPINSSCLSDLVPVSFSENPATVQMLFGTSDMWENVAPFKAPDTPPPGWDAFVEELHRAARIQSP